jgi:hypothetical protein
MKKKILEQCSCCHSVVVELVMVVLLVLPEAHGRARSALRRSSSVLRGLLSLTVANLQLGKHQTVALRTRQKEMGPFGTDAT